VIVPGHVILLSAADKAYRYHAGDGRVIYCQRALR
jgi:hypothetical protein